MAEGRNYGVGGYINRPAEAAYTAITDGLVVQINASGEVILALNTGNVYGIANRSSQDKVARTAGITQFLTGVAITGGVPILKSGIVELELGSTNVTIAIGDRIVVHADDDGTVNGAADETAVADKYLTVGYAESAVAQDVGGKVLVNLTIAVGNAP